MEKWLKLLVENRRVRPWGHVAIFLISFALVASRRPDALFNAQFWGEDSFVFYADAYRLGWFPAIFHTYAGYFHLVPRIATAFAILVPLHRAPLVMNIIAIAAYALTVNLLLSNRLMVWGSLRFRTFLAASYLALPISREVLAIFTDIQWVLVISALLIVMSASPRNAIERICDSAFLLGCGLSGPFCFFLLPIAAFVAHRRREPWRMLPVGILLLCVIIQACALLFLGHEPRSAFLGATPYLFLRILGENVFLAPFFGVQLVQLVNGTHAFLFELSVAAAGTLLTAVMLPQARRETRLFFLLATMVFATSLISPATRIGSQASAWQLLAEANGIRYWFLPALAFLWLLMDAAQRQSKLLRSLSLPLLCLFCVCAMLQWRQPAFPDLHFPEDAARFEAAPNGAILLFHENPDGRIVCFVKRGSVGR